MDPERAAPCRHAGAPRPEVVGRVAALLRSLQSDEAWLARNGLTPAEYAAAFPVALEALRGSKSASNAQRRRFLVDLFTAMRHAGTITRFDMPAYGEDTVYRLVVPQVGEVAIIQKGCPDGAHSSVRWRAPEWARETYLWWLCPSVSGEPGEHIVKGVNRLRQRFFSAQPDTIDGVIFHNDLCGTSKRPCPKAALSIEVAGCATPPPCVYVMPDRREGAVQWNWAGDRQLRFPRALFGFFGIEPNLVPSYLGHIGFERRNGELRTNVTARFGPARVTNYRK